MSSGAGSGLLCIGGNFRLGQGYGEKRFFRGLLSDVRIYRMALSPAEVQAVMNEGHEKSGDAGKSNP